jgi:hypothetical protein
MFGSIDQEQYERNQYANHDTGGDGKIHFEISPVYDNIPG